jgi:hypothetical protein
MHTKLRDLLTAALLSITVSACAPKGHVTKPTFESGQYTFTNPKQAVTTLKNALEAHDTAELARIFGPQSGDLLSSGDSVADTQSFNAFAGQMNEKTEVVERVNQNPALKNQRLAFLYVGQHGYPFPIALHKRANGWRFDTAVGKEELINRRIGRNEIRAIEALNTIIGAQRSFYENQVKGGSSPQYAQRLFSSPEKQDGLYWEKVDGKPLSPLGAAIAAASSEGYTLEKLKTRRTYYGYHFAVLTKQGPEARGGAMSYLDEKGRMTKGFAVLAYPAKFGESGVMTFVAGPDGMIYQKNLGPNTESLGRKMTSINPGLSWLPVR